MAEMVKWQSRGISRLRRHLVPAVVWLAAAGAVGWLFTGRPVQVVTEGLARGEQRQIATESNGRLLLLPVSLFEEVRQGQTLAALEDERVLARLATAAAETARLRAELAAAADLLSAEADAQVAEVLADARRFALDVEQARVKVLELTVAIETDRITMQRLQFTWERLRQLSGTDTAAADELDAAQTEYAALQKCIAENTILLAQLQRDLEAAQDRHDAYARINPLAPEVDQALEPLRAGLAVQECRVGELALDRAMLVLHSPIDGVVSEVLRRPGEIVMAGQPIMVVSTTRPVEVVTYANAAQVAQVKVDMPVQLSVRRSGRQEYAARARVTGIGPALEQLPARLWRSPAVPEWGWPIGVSVPTGFPLLPGETVLVQAP